MKKSLFALAALGTFASIAHAQSSVTIYGIIDEGVNYTSNVKGNSLWQLASGNVQGSRFGFKGAEDLGGGLKAIFQLENGFNASNGALGQGGLMFGRQAYVGLSSATYGAVTMGRQYDSVVDYLGPLTANGGWAGQLFSHPYDNDNTDNSFRINNSVKYTSANYAGLQFGGLYGFSNTAGGFSSNNAWSLGAQYVAGPVKVAAAYMNLNNPGSNCGGAVTGSAEAPLSCTGAEASFGSVQKQRVAGLGASYTAGPVILGLVGTETYVNATASTSVRFLNGEANAQWFINPAFVLSGMYDYTRVTSADNNYHINVVGVMADYFLSKRTDVYLQGIYSLGSSTSSLGDGLVGSTYGVGVEIPGSGGASSGTNQAVVRVALRVKF